jgi:hypothetical protein
MGFPDAAPRPPPARAAFLAEWTSARRFTKRVANLRATYLKVSGPEVTVFDDAAVNVLSGASRTDWFFAHRSGGVALDILNGLGSNEIVEGLGALAP